MASNFDTRFHSQARLLLGGEEAHVWRVMTGRMSSWGREFLDLLAPDERDRAYAFYFQKDHDRFVVARGALRIILGRYLNLAPQQLRFSYSPFGKPALTDATGGKELRFNLSHSHDISLYAVTRRREIGVDIEYLRKDFEWRPIAEQQFSGRETARLRALPADLQTRAFFSCWTYKEAYLKARGEGLYLPLDRIEVSQASGEPARVLGTLGDLHAATCYSLYELTPGPDYVAALAVEGQSCEVACWHFEFWR